MIFSDNFKNENHYMIKFRKRQSAIIFDDAFPYLAKRYNLKQVAVVANSPRSTFTNGCAKCSQCCEKVQS